MADIDVALSLYVNLAQSAESLSPLAQVQIASAAASSKSAAGDRILAALAKRDDICAEVRGIVEASPRAAVKAAWLSRGDHPDGYAAAAVAQEKRVTVLTAVAEHPDASPELVEALASRGLLAVAVAVAKRSDSSMEALESALATMLSCGQTMSWAQRQVFEQALGAHPELHTAIAAHALRDTEVRFLLSSRAYEFPEVELPRVCKILLSSFDLEALVASSSSWHSPFGEVVNVLNSLVSQRNWQPGSDEDANVASVAQAVGAAAQAAAASGARYGVQRLTAELSDCVARNFGTAQQRKDALDRRQQRKEAIRAAETANDPAMFARIASGHDAALTAALCRNPNVRLEHLSTVTSSELIGACMARGDDRLLGLAMLRCMYYMGPKWVSEKIPDEDAPEVARLAIQYLRRCSGSRSSVRISPHHLAALFQDRRLVEAAIPELTSVELVSLLEYYRGDDSRAGVPSAVANAIAGLLSEQLTDSEQWSVFTSLIGEMETPIRESIVTARTL